MHDRQLSFCNQTHICTCIFINNNNIKKLLHTCKECNEIYTNNERKNVTNVRTNERMNQTYERATTFYRSPPFWYYCIKLKKPFFLIPPNMQTKNKIKKLQLQITHMYTHEHTHLYKIRLGDNDYIALIYFI